VVSTFQNGLTGSVLPTRILSSHRGLRYKDAYACTLMMCFQLDLGNFIITIGSIVPASSEGKTIGRTYCGVNKRHLCFAYLETMICQRRWNIAFARPHRLPDLPRSRYPLLRLLSGRCPTLTLQGRMLSEMQKPCPWLRVAARCHQVKSSHRCNEATHVGIHVSYAAFNCSV
jgi:hypothetical protein